MKAEQMVPTLPLGLNAADTATLLRKTTHQDIAIGA
jgi:hypothetical protein